MTENNMYIPPLVKSEISDESEYDAEPEEFDVYKKKYQLLLDRCEVLQQVSRDVVTSLELFHLDGSQILNCLLCRTTKDWFIEFKGSGSC